MQLSNHHFNNHKTVSSHQTLKYQSKNIEDSGWLYQTKYLHITHIVYHLNYRSIPPYFMALHHIQYIKKEKKEEAMYAKCQHLELHFIPKISLFIFWLECLQG